MTTTHMAANRTWLLLLLATAITWWLGESGSLGNARPLAASIVLGLAFTKGVLVILDFMELRHAPVLWKRLIIGWLIFVLGMIALAYRTGLH